MERIRVVTRVICEGVTEQDFEVTGTCTGEWLEPDETPEQAIRNVATRALDKAIEIAQAQMDLKSVMK